MKFSTEILTLINSLLIHSPFSMEREKYPHWIALNCIWIVLHWQKEKCPIWSLRDIHPFHELNLKTL